MEKKICLIGCGHISHRHIDAINNINGAKLIGVTDIKREKAHNIGLTNNCADFDDYKEMIIKLSPDIVHICTPHYLHYEMVIFCINNGVNVIVEKPLALSRNEINEIISLSQKNKICVKVVFQNRYNQAVIRCKEILKDKTYGEVIGIRAILTWKRDTSYFTESEWRREKTKSGGGVIINQAIHMLDIMRFLGGDVINSRCKIHNMNFFDIEVEDTAEGCIEFESGIKGIFYATINGSTNMPVEIDVITGQAILKLYGDSLLIIENGNINADLLQINHQMMNREICYGNSHKSLIEDFYNSLNNIDKSIVELKDVYKTMQLIFMLYESSK